MSPLLWRSVGLQMRHRTEVFQVFSMLLLCIASLSILAQPKNLPFRHLRSGVEMPGTFVEFIFKDHQGYVWFGTEQGLARYNGQTTETFSSAQGLNGLAVTSPFFEDTVNNLLWFSTDRAINCYRRNQHDFKSVPIVGTQEKPQLFYQDASRRLWVRTAEGAVIILDPLGKPADEPEQYRQTQAGTNEGTTFCVGVDPAKKDISYILTAYSFDPERRGLRYHIFENEKLTLQGPLNKVRNEGIVKILPFDSVSVWLICHTKIILFDFKKDKIILEKPFDGYRANDAIYLDQAKILLATTTGVHLYTRADNNILQLYQADPSRNDRLRKNEIQKLYLDSDSILWVSHWEGIDFASLKKVKFRAIDFSALNLNSPLNFVPKSIVELPDGRFWFGSNFVGELREMLPSGQIKPLSLPKPHQKFAADLMYALRNGQILLSNLSSRSYWYDNFTFLPIRQNGENLYFSTFCQLGNDAILGGNEAGIFLLQKGRNGAIATAVGTPFRKVKLLARDEAGRVFVGHGDRMVAICHWQNGALIHLDSLRVEGELKTFCETSSHLWFGGTFGLLRCDKGNLHNNSLLTTAHGLPHKIVYGILTDSLGRLWISTHKGLAMLNPANNQVHRFGIADGIQHWEYNTHAFFKDSKGQLWFGGMGGFNVFDPEQVRFLEDEPKILLTEFNINYRPYHDILRDVPANVNLFRQIHLNHNQNNLYFTFTVLEYSNPENIEFQYQLTPADSNPIDTAWTTIRGAQASFTFSQLSPGKHKLHIRSTNSDGKWLIIPLVMDIFIEIPYWQHPLFILSCIALAFAVGFWISNYRQQIEIDKLTAVNKERDRIARDMHDDILKSFGVIRRKLEELASHPEHLDDIIEQINQVETDTRVVIDAFNFKHDTLLHTIYFTTEKLVEFIEGENLTAVVHQPETIPDITLSGRQRKNLYFAAQEAVNNAVKYSRSSEIHISFEVSEQNLKTSLIISIRDFGIGLSDNKVSPAGHGHGTVNIMSRLDEIGGFAKIMNAEPGPGVQVTLVLPLKTAKILRDGKD